ncbi:lipopolysaccharide biosynthesis protein [Sphingobium aromaticiconvertens]|uniref:lipopolysaccharide biosynthesis protein n=1 Tax=Sphingobium aromaticiconvertens TaxID=365341 RepID=UPI0030158B86
MASPLYKHTLIYMFGRIGPALLNLIATAIFTRMVAPTEYAVLVLSVAAAQLGSAGLFQWLRMSVLRYAVGDDAPKVIGTITRLYLLQGAVCVGLMLILCFILPLFHLPWLVSITCGIMILAQSWFDYTQELQRAALQPIRYSLSFGARGLLALIIGSAGAYLTGSGFVLVLCVATAYFIAPVPFMGAMFGRPDFSRDPELTRRIVMYGLPLGAALLLNNVGVMADRFIVAYILGAEAAGLYGPTVELGRQSIFTLLQSVTLASYPLAIRALKNHGAAAAIDQMARNFGFLMIIALPSAAGLAIMRGEIAQIMLGPLFRATAEQLFPLVALSTLLLSLNTFYFIQGNQLGENTRGQAAVAAIAAIATLALNFLFIPMWGLWGAAIAAIGSQAISLASSIIISRRSFPLPVPLRHIIRPGAATIVMAFTLMVVQHFWPGTAILRTLCLFALAGVSYAGAVLLFDAGDMRQLAFRAIRRKS